MLGISRGRSSHTLLVITGSRVARLDFNGRQPSMASQSRSEPRLHDSSVHSAIQQAIELAEERLSSQVTLLCTDFWTDILSLPADVVAISSHSELEQVLAIDAEVESKLPALHAKTVIEPLHAGLNQSSNLYNSQSCETQVCTTQIADAVIDLLNDSVRRAHGRLRALAHPIALDLALSKLDGKPAFQALHQWQSGDAAGPISANEEPAWLEHLAERWLKATDGATRPLPLAIHFPSRSQQFAPLLLGGCLTLATCLGCINWDLQCRASRRSLVAATKQLEQQLSEHERTSTHVSKLEKQLDKLRQSTESAEQTRQELQRKQFVAKHLERTKNHRWSSLFTNLVTTAEDCWVQRISVDGPVTLVQGIAPSASVALGFSVRLEQQLRGCGWEVAPAVTSVLKHDLCHFQIALKPVVASLDSTTPAVASSHRFELRLTQVSR